MKRIITSLLFLSAGLLSLSSCENKVHQFAPGTGENLPATEIENITYASTPGQIVIHWTHDAEAKGTDLLYVKATYLDPHLNETVTHFGSAAGDSVVMPNTYKAAGTYKVTLIPISRSGKEGNSKTIDVVSEPVPSKLTFFEDKFTNIALTADMLSTNAQQPGEGPLPGICDGNTDTYFHSRWQGKIDEQHYVQVELKEAIDALQVQFITRHNGNGGGNVLKMKIYASNDAKDWTEIAEESYPDVGTGVTVKGEPRLLDGTYKYLRFTPTATKQQKPLVKSWFNMAELILKKPSYAIVDFEALAKEKIDSFKK